MNYFDIKQYLERPVFKIFRMDNPALPISFLYREFKINGRVVIDEENLEQNLIFYAQGIQNNYKENLDIKDASILLNEWSNKGFLRRTAPFGKMQREYELTPAIEKVFLFLEDSTKKEFIGTESRLLKIFELLKEISFRSSDSPSERISELEKKKLEIEMEIEEIKNGKLKKFTNTQLKERYIDLYETARRLLSDFREVEYNFREIDLMIREKAILSDSNRGNLLNQIFEKENFLYDSDQGKSFQAFLEFLISEEKKEELNQLIETMLSIPDLKEVKKDSTGIDRDHFFRSLKYFMVTECQKVGKTNSKIAEGLKKFIVEKTYIENKRIIEILSEIKQAAIGLKNLSTKKEAFTQIEEKPEISLIMERPYFIPAEEVVINDITIGEGDDKQYSQEELSILYKRIYIDKEVLKTQIKDLLKKHSQVSIGEILKAHPSEKGLLDVLGYFSLTSEGLPHTIDENNYDTVLIMNKESGKYFQAKVPSLVFHND